MMTNRDLVWRISLILKQMSQAPGIHFDYPTNSALMNLRTDIKKEMTQEDLDQLYKDWDAEHGVTS